MLFFAVACIMAACNNDNKMLNKPQYISEFKAVFGSADTRMAATPDNGLKFSWEDGDVLYVHNPADKDDYFEYKYNSATDAFQLDYGHKNEEGMTVNTSYFATSSILYANAFTTVDGEFAVKTQLYSEGVTEMPLISGLFLAKADGTIAAMHHTVGVVEIPVKLGAGSTITELSDISIYIPDAKVVGEFYATPKSPYYVGVVEDGDYFDESYACQSETLNESTAVSFFIPMLPGVYTNPQLWYYDEDGDLATDSVKLNGTLTVECGKVTKLPVQELALINTNDNPDK